MVGQIDKLTGDIDLDADADADADADECTAASEREPSDTHRDTLHHPSQDTLSDPCSSGTVSENPLLGSKTELRGNQPQMVPSGGAQVNGRNCFTPNSPKGSCFTPDSRKGSFNSPFGSWASVSGGGRCFSERELHALCCDDDDDDDEEGRSSLVRSSRLSSSDSVFSSPPPLHPLALATLTPGHRRKMQRSCATQTVSDKSTQTAWPYVSNKDLRAQRETKSLCFKERP